MPTFQSCTWSGVFPAATTQFDAAMEVDLPATQRMQSRLVRDGVHSLVFRRAAVIALIERARDSRP